MEEKIGDLIKRLRTEKGYSVKDIAEKTGFSVVEIKSIEANKFKPRVFNLVKFANALDVDYDFLFSIRQINK